MSMLNRVVGTLVGLLVATTLPAGTWSTDLVASLFHGERITHTQRSPSSLAWWPPGARSRADETDWGTRDPCRRPNTAKQAPG
jgi:hypothetical protein